MSRVRLRFFDHNGTELDTVIIWRDGNCASIRAHSAWVEVTIVEDEAALTSTPAQPATSHSTPAGSGKVFG